MGTRRTFLHTMGALAAAPPAAVLAQSDPTVEIVALMDKWAAFYMTSLSPDGIVSLYADDAVFWGTASQVPFIGAATFGPYFQTQFTNFSKRRVTFHDPVIRVYGGGQFATNIGTYEFDVEPASGQRLQVRHRYSFAYVRQQGNWRIAQQHSSAMPR
jgi:uncharacterized protein (TIGR02246 family)